MSKQDIGTREETGSSAPKGPIDLPLRSWWQVLKRTVKQFQEDDLTDWAAALTYYGILSLFPALLVLISTLGLISRGTRDTVINNIKQLVPGTAGDVIGNVIGNVQSAPKASGGGPRPGTSPRSCAPPTRSTTCRRAGRSGRPCHCGSV